MEKDLKTMADKLKDLKTDIYITNMPIDFKLMMYRWIEEMEGLITGLCE